MEKVGSDMEKVVVGKIVKIEKHPDADKLVVCRLDVGQEEPVQIVTGATNVFEGAYVPVALSGSRIPGPLHGQPKKEGGVKIEAGKLRGVKSDGMLCSFGELGFTDKVVPVSYTHLEVYKRQWGLKWKPRKNGYGARVLAAEER